MRTHQAIGFANKFYTLWDISEDDKYITDVNGKHWLSGTTTYFTYIKNISFDLEKAKQLHPGLFVDENLRGKTTSWQDDKGKDLCPQIMKFGKHLNEDLNDIVNTDFNYVLWLIENGNYSSNRNYASEMEVVKNHLKELEDKIEKEIKDREKAFDKIVKKGVYEFVAERNLSVMHDYSDCSKYNAYCQLEIDGVNVYFVFPKNLFSEYFYNGFSYALPIIDGKAKRIKGKKLRIKFEEHSDENLIQSVLVNEIEILK